MVVENFSCSFVNTREVGGKQKSSSRKAMDLDKIQELNSTQSKEI